MKKILSVLLAAVMVLGLTTGCVSQYVTEEDTQEKTQTQTQATQGQTEPGTQGETAAPTEEDISGVEIEVWYAVSGTSGELFNKQSEAFAKETGVKQVHVGEKLLYEATV